MDSRDIYNQTRREIEWAEKWIHIGTRNDTNTELIKSIIIEQFGSQSTIQLKRGRKNFQTLQMNEVLDKITRLIGKEDFELWNEKFNKAIKFNKIGVMNISKYAM